MPLVRVGPLPDFLPVDRLLGPSTWRIEHDEDGRWAAAELPVSDAADIAARLRGLAFGGLDTQVQIRPSLKRPAVRAGRLREARARRDTSPGFRHPAARLDEEGRRSLTPEDLALAVGRAAHRADVLDLTTGAGGNAIGFARAGCTVHAIELDPARLALARHNAALYGVADRITFTCADARDVLQHLQTGLIFVDPPWGPYDKRRTTLQDLPLLQALLPDLQRFARVWLKLPPSFDVRTLPAPCQVEPMFGASTGDQHRVKFLLVRQEPAHSSTSAPA